MEELSGVQVLFIPRVGKSTNIFSKASTSVCDLVSATVLAAVFVLLV